MQVDSDPYASTPYGGMAHNRYHPAVELGLDPQHTEAALGAMEGYSPDCTDLP